MTSPGVSEPTQQDIQALTAALKELTRTFGTSSKSSGGSSSRPGGTTRSSVTADGPYSDLSTGKNPKYSKAMTRMTEQLDAAQRGVKKLTENSSLLAAATISTTKVLSETRQLVFFKDMLEKSGEMLKNGINPNFVALARSMRMLKDGSDEFRDGLQTADFVQLSMAVASTGDAVSKANEQATELIKTIEAQVDDAGKMVIAQIRGNGGSAMAQVSKIQSAGILGIDDDSNTMPGEVSSKLNKIVDDLKATLKEQGVAAGSLNDSTENLIETFDKLNDETIRVNQTLIQTTKDHISVIGHVGQSFNALKGHLHTFGKSILATVASLGSLANLKTQGKGILSDMKMFNVAHVADGFMSMQIQSAKLGMSFADTVKLYQENARVLTVYGADRFETLLGGLGDTFNKYGYTFEQGSKLIGPAVENAVLSGVNVSNQAAMTSYMDQSLKNAQTMAAVTGKTPEAIMAMHKSALESEGVFKTLMGMDKERRGAYAKEITQSIDRLVLAGVEYEQAVEIVNAQQQAARAPVRKKMEEAAFGMIGARLAGMNEQEIGRLAQLERQTGYAAGEQEEMAALRAKRGQGMETKFQAENVRTGNNAQGFLYTMQTVKGKMAQDDAAVTAMAKAQQKQEAGLVPTADQVKATAAAAAGNKTAAEVLQWGDIINSVLGNSFIGGLVAATAAIASLALGAAQAYLSLKYIGALGAGGLAGKTGLLKGGGGTILGKAAGLGKNLLKGGLAGAVISIGGNMAGEAIGGQLGGAVSGAATGAGIGSTIGMLGGPVGMAIGAGVGALAGGAYGYFTTPGSTTDKPGVNTDTLAAESMQSLSNQTVTVTDKEANANLQAIAASMTEAVALLRTMVGEEATTVMRKSTYQVPSASQYVTGNG